jgi:arabinofuranan 3-O-arabinosyltransferase
MTALVSESTPSRSQAQAQPAAPPTWRAGMRHVAVCLVLVAVAVKQAPGRLIADTKLDLTVDPGGLLERSLHLWEPLGSFGQVQNQAYGYLWPMGPFFLLGELMQVPEWLVQRAWLALLLCLAYLGAARLAARLGIGTPYTHIVTGLVYVLSPRMLSTIGAISVEALPMAMAPWVLLPLVKGAESGSPRRAAAWSGLAVACIGGVNAAASIAVLPLGLLWLLTRGRGPRRTQLLRWWLLAVGLATAWWVVPLLVLGRYSPPFLDFIESASVTTSTTSLVETLRGTSHWIPYITTSDGPLWPAGSLLLTNGVLVLDTVLVTAVGLCGLTRRDLPHRLWLWLCLATGVALVTMGHVADIDGLFAGDVRGLLDGILAPLRNVHKFDPVLRLPLALAVGHVLAALVSAATADRAARVRRAAVTATVAAVLMGVAAPALVLRLPSASFVEVPGYWRQATDWVESRADGGRTLLVPGSSFADYYWGSAGDEPAQALLNSPWAVRSAIPLAPAETIRLLDSVEARLRTGHGSAGLAEVLARSGVRYLLVRNDLDYARAGSARPLLVHQALSDSPGLSQVAAFGGLVGGENRPGNLRDQDLDVPFRAVEIYQVAPWSGMVAAYPASSALRVSGTAESLLPLADLGWATGRPVVFTGTTGEGATSKRSPASATVVTDTPRLREVFFGRIADNRSQTLMPGEPRRIDSPVGDYLDPETRDRTVPARVTGLRNLSVSSSASDANALGGSRADRQPSAAVDGSLATAWWPDPGKSPDGSRLRLRFWHPVPVETMQVHLDFPADSAAARPDRLEVRTALGRQLVEVDSGGRAVLHGAGRSDWIEVRPVAGEGAGTFGIAEVTVAGVDPTRTLLVRGDPAATAYDFRVPDDRVDSCFRYVDRPLCATGVAHLGEEAGGIDRTIERASAGDYRVRIEVRPRPGPLLDRLLSSAEAGASVEASSAAVADPMGRPRSAFDGDRGTGWVAAPGDHRPWLRIRLERAVLVDGLRFVVDGALAASSPRRVSVSLDGGEPRRYAVDGDGRLTLPDTRAHDVQIWFDDVNIATSYNPLSRTRSLLPVGVSEVQVRTPEDTTAAVSSAREDDVVIPCGAGPDLHLGATTVATGGRVGYADLAAMRDVELIACGAGAASLPAGRVRLEALSKGAFAVTGLALERFPLEGVDRNAVTARARSWDATRREVAVGPRAEATLLAVRENQNDGWAATLNGRTLPKVTVDGWQQAWLLPAGQAATVELRFTPDPTYRTGLVLGLAALVALCVLALVRPRDGPARAVPRTGESAARVGWIVAGSLVLPAVGGLLGLGLWLVVVALALALVRTGTLPRPAASVASVLAATCYLGAGCWLAVRPWGSDGYAGTSAVVQLLSVLALGAVCVSQLLADEPAAAAAAPARSSSPLPAPR